MQRDKRLFHKKAKLYLMVRLHGVLNTLLLPLLPAPLWSVVVVLVMVSFMGQIDLFKKYSYLKLSSLLGWRIHRLLLCRGVWPHPLMSVMDMALNNLMVLWVMHSTSSLPWLPGPLWPGVVAPDKGPIKGLNRTKPRFQEGFFAFKLCIYAKLNCLK